MGILKHIYFSKVLKVGFIEPPVVGKSWQILKDLVACLIGHVN